MPRSSPNFHVRRFSLSTLLLAAAAGFASAPAGAQTFTPAVNISNSSADSSLNQMAVVSPNVYVTWQDFQGSQGPKFSRSINGGPFSAPIEIFKGVAQGGQIGPYIAATGSNVYVARSVRLKPQQPVQVFFRRSTDNGATFGDQVQLSASVNGAILQAMAASGASVYLVWTQSVGNNSDVFFVRSTNGGAFSAPVNLSNTSTNTVNNVRLAADGLGVHVTWSEDVGVDPDLNWEIYYTGSTDGGANFRPVFNVSNSPARSFFPDIAVSGLHVYLAWREAEIRFSASADGGLSFGVPVDLSSGMSDTRGVGGGPQLAAFGSDVHVIWHANPGGGNYDVFYTRSIGGAAFGTPRDVSCDPSCAGALNSPTGVIAVNEANVYISWSGGSSTAREIYMAHSINTGLTFGPNINVSSTLSADSGGPQLVATPTEVHVIWLDHMPGNWDVFYRRSIP